MKAAKEEKEGDEDRRYLLNFNFISFKFSHGYSIARNVFWTIWEPSFLPNQALKFTSHFRWLISPKSWFQRCRFSKSRHCFRLLNLISHVFAANSCVKEHPFCAPVEAEFSSHFFLFAEMIPFPSMRCSRFLLEASEHLGISWTYFILFF